MTSSIYSKLNHLSFFYTPPTPRNPPSSDHRRRFTDSRRHFYPISRALSALGHERTEGLCPPDRPAERLCSRTLGRRNSIALAPPAPRWTESISSIMVRKPAFSTAVKGGSSRLAPPSKPPMRAPPASRAPSRSYATRGRCVVLCFWCFSLLAYRNFFWSPIATKIFSIN